jgi:ribulose-phosphate 3-epimerase
MIVEPNRYAVEFVRAGANMVSVHVEADVHLHRTLGAIRGAGGKSGIAINPATSLVSLEEALPYADFVLLMSVNPGFGGQSFIPSALPKIARVREMIDRSGREIRLEVDGGVKVDNIEAVAAAGADTFVAGSAIFGSKDYRATIAAMRAAIAKAVSGK